MSFLDLIGVTSAHAATTTATAQQHGAAGGLFTFLPMMILLIAVFYFLLIRPQTKRAKEQRKLLDNLSVGDEIITAGGIVGRLTKLRDNFVVLSVSNNMEIILQKNSIASVLPKGTIDSVK